MKVISGDWKRRLLPMLKLFADRLPGAAIEEKDYSLVWHYRGADPDQAELFAHELADNLNALTGNVDIQVVQANKAIEVRVAGINKGTAAEEIMAGGEFDFIFAIGDDRTDEDLFGVLPESAWTVKVGNAQSRARYNCAGVEDVLTLLSLLASSSNERTGPAGPVTRAVRFLERLTTKMAGQ